MKPVHFVGSSRDDLRELPDDARETAGHQLFKVQQGKEPDDWKPMSTVGIGVNEIRVRDEGGSYRVLYVAKFEEGSTCCMFSRSGLKRLRKAISNSQRLDMPTC
jgi:phage-related protein